MFRKMPVILVTLIIAVVLLDAWLPLIVKTNLYALSLTIKSFIIFILPFVIFSLLFKTAAQLAHHATKIILFILVTVCCSNFISTFLSHYVGVAIYHLDFTLAQPNTGNGLMPAWSVTFPKLIGNDKAMLLGLLLGIALGYIKALRSHSTRVIIILDKFVGRLLQVLTFLIPFFITGFVIKLNDDGNMKMIVQHYSLILAMIFVAQFSYIFLIYFLANQLKFKSFLNSLKNMLPAAIAGFTTMSSASAMPLTLIGTEKNVKHAVLGRATIPATVNIHLIGDCFAIPILAFAILKSFAIPEPLFVSYLIFSLFFVLAKFSVAAVPGGGILVMLPILENYLGFNAQMMSLITALYILFDPIITSANVLGNGAFAMVIDKSYGFLVRGKQ